MGKDWDRLDPGVGAERLRDRENFTPRKSEFKDGVGTNVGAPKKNPRCRKCGKLKFDHEKGKCRCSAPDWNTRQSEYAYLQQVWHEAWATEALRVLKPGGHLLAFGGSRTYHRLVCAVEDAGFEIRDTISWLYGSGFPKSLDVGKAIDKAARGVPQGGADPSSPHHGEYRTTTTEGKRWDGDSGQGYGAGGSRFLTTTASERTAQQNSAASAGTLQPSTLDATASEWEGFGTALKPAHEPVVVARKPLSGTVSQTVLEHGTGALNIDATRVGWGEEGDKSAARKEKGYSEAAKKALGGVVASEDSTGFAGEVVGTDASAGRWPANVVLSHMEECVPAGTRKVKGATSVGRNRDGSEVSNEVYGARRKDTTDQGYAGPDGTETVTAWRCHPDCPVRLLDEQTGELTSGSRAAGEYGRLGYQGWDDGPMPAIEGDAGGASRFFPTFKQDGDETRFRYVAKAGQAERSAGLPTGQRSSHPTVKPVALMQWLVRLVTPPEVPCPDCEGTGHHSEGHPDEFGNWDFVGCPTCESGGTVPGRVLDPFCGSGSTGCAAVLEGFDFVGLEREEEYVKIAEARIAWWFKHRGDGEAAEILAAGEARDEVEATGQGSLFDEAA